MKRSFFVYGTLRSEMGNHSLLEQFKRVGLRSLGDAHLNGFELWHMQGLPVIRKTGSAEDVVIGEVFEGEAMTEAHARKLEGYLDSLEHAYIAEEVTVTLARTGEGVKAWAFRAGDYWYSETTRSFETNPHVSKIESGDYKAFIIKRVDAYRRETEFNERVARQGFND